MYNSMPRDLVEVNQAKALVVARSYLGFLLLLWTWPFRARLRGLKSARTSWRSSSSTPAFLGCQRSCFVLVIQYSITHNLCWLRPQFLISIQEFLFDPEHDLFQYGDIPRSKDARIFEMAITKNENSFQNISTFHCYEPTICIWFLSSIV